MELYAYIRLPVNIIREEIIIQYNIIAMNKNRYFYSENRKVTYVFPQSVIIANDLLTNNIAPR